MSRDDIDLDINVEWKPVKVAWWNETCEMCGKKAEVTEMVEGRFQIMHNRVWSVWLCPECLERVKKYIKNMRNEQ